MEETLLERCMLAAGGWESVFGVDLVSYDGCLMLALTRRTGYGVEDWR